MARTCDTIFPAGILTGSGTIQIPNFEDLVKSYDDPLYRYDLKLLSVLSVLLNSLLSTIDLDDYPNLKERLDSDDGDGGVIGLDELANILNDTGLDPGTLKDAFLSDFPVEINLDLVDYLVTELDGVTTLDPDFIIENEAEIVENVINNAPEVIPDEFDFNYQVNPWTPSIPILQILFQFEEYYSDNLSDVYTSSVCDGIFKIANTFTKVISTVRDIILGISNVLTSISNFLRRVLDIYNLITNLFTKFNDFLGMLNQGIGQVISSLQTVISEKIAAFTTQISNLTTSIGEGARLFTSMTTSLGNAQSFLGNGQNLIQMVDGINAGLMKFYNQYIEPWPAVIAKVANIACNILRSVERALRHPIEYAKQLLREAVYRTDIYKAYTGLAQDWATLSGGYRLPLNQRLLSTNSAAITINSPQRLPSNLGTIPTDGTAQEVQNTVTLNPTNYVTLRATEAELNYIAALTEDGCAEFDFTESVKQMGKIARGTYENGREDPTYKGPIYDCANRPEDHAKEWNKNQNFPEAGWKMISNVHPFMYVALRRVASRLGKKLTITSGYRSPYYNRIVLRHCRGNTGAAHNSLHMSAMALDISTNNLTNYQTALLIKFCSQEGFNRISVYNSFIHVDIKGGAYRGNWTNNYRGNADIRRSMEMHLQRQHTDGPV